MDDLIKLKAKGFLDSDQVRNLSADDKEGTILNIGLVRAVLTPQKLQFHVSRTQEFNHKSLFGMIKQSYLNRCSKNAFVLVVSRCFGFHSGEKYLAHPIGERRLVIGIAHRRQVNSHI